MRRMRAAVGLVREMRAPVGLVREMRAAVGFTVCNIEDTSVCPLARVMRRELRNRGIEGDRKSVV